MCIHTFFSSHDGSVEEIEEVVAEIIPHCHENLVPLLSIPSHTNSSPNDFNNHTEGEYFI